MNEPSVAQASSLPGSIPNRDRGSVLRAENVHRFFVDGGRRLDVLKGVNFSLQAGKIGVLVGRSGSGKSTLLHLLGLLDLPNAGEILIDGTPAGTLSEVDRAYLRNRHIGFVFQHYFLLPEFNVLENVMLPAKVACSLVGWRAKEAAHRARALELLELLGLANQARQSPATLSGGERQRAALARAMILEPKLLLCDEPTGNLDPESAENIMNMIFRLGRECSTGILVVTHDQGMANRADSLFRLEEGLLKIEK